MESRLWGSDGKLAAVATATWKMPKLVKNVTRGVCIARHAYGRIYLALGKGGMFWLDWLGRIFAGLFWMPIC